MCTKSKVGVKNTPDSAFPRTLINIFLILAFWDISFWHLQYMFWVAKNTSAESILFLKVLKITFNGYLQGYNICFGCSKEPSLRQFFGVSTTCFGYSKHLSLLWDLSLPWDNSFNNIYLLITFANSLDPDQTQHFVGPDLDPNCLTPWWYWKNTASKE